MMCLVDLFDVYDKVQEGFVDESHLNTRINALRLGVMKSDAGKGVWNYMKRNRSKEFNEWFEFEVYERELEVDPNQQKRTEGMNIIRE